MNQRVVLRGELSPRFSTDHFDGEGEDEDDADDIHGYGKRRKGEEFARLAERTIQCFSDIFFPSVPCVPSALIVSALVHLSISNWEPHPPASLSPPVPPVSTLASPVSSRAPGAPPGLSVMIAPVLPPAIMGPHMWRVRLICTLHNLCSEACRERCRVFPISVILTSNSTQHTRRFFTG